MVGADLPANIRSRLAEETEVGGLPYRRLDVAWNEMTMHAIKHELGGFNRISRDVESLVSVVLYTLRDDPSEVRALLKGARNSVSGSLKFWDSCLELVQKGREELWNEHGIYISGVIRK